MNNIKQRLLLPFSKTKWNVRRMRVCGNTQGSSIKGGQGPLSWPGVEGRARCLFTVRKYDLRAPASSHRITCDRGEPPPYKSPPLLLFSPSPSSLRLARYAASSTPDKNKSHVYCLAVCHSPSFPSSRFVLVTLP